MNTTATTAPYLDNSFRVGRGSLADEALYIYASEPLPQFGQQYPDYPDWNYLDSGSYRVVMLHVPTQVVYKLPYSEGHDYVDNGENSLVELENWRRMLAHPEYAPFVPEHQAWSCYYNDQWICVMAVPYMGGYPMAIELPIPMALGEAADHVGCGDAGIRNVRKYGGRWHLIDAGGSTDGPIDSMEHEGAGCQECNPSTRSYDNA